MKKLEKIMNKKFKFILVSTITLIALCVIFFLTTYEKSAQESIQEFAVSNSVEDTETKEGVENTSIQWKTYISEKDHFAIDYPDTWNVENNEIVAGSNYQFCPPDLKDGELCRVEINNNLKRNRGLSTAPVQISKVDAINFPPDQWDKVAFISADLKNYFYVTDDYSADDYIFNQMKSSVRVLCGHVVNKNFGFEFDCNDGWFIDGKSSLNNYFYNKKTECESDDFHAKKQINLLSGSFGVSVVCDSFSEQHVKDRVLEGLPEFLKGEFKNLYMVQGSQNTIYGYSFVSGTNYKNYLGFIPLDQDHYIEVSYSDKVDLIDDEWVTFLKSFKVKK